MMRNKALVLSCLPYARAEAAFTLAELLLSLIILAVVTAFAVPKVLNTSQTNRYSAAAKEVMGMIAGAYTQYKATGASAGQPIRNLAQYMNYVKYDTTSIIDDTANTGGGTLACNASLNCIKLYNGGILMFWPWNFQATNCTGNVSVSFTFDPDGVQNSATPSVEFELFNDGRISTLGQMTAADRWDTSTCAGTPFGPGPYDPPWLQW